MCTTYRVVHKTSPTKMTASQIRLFVRNCPWLQVFNWPLFCLSKSGTFLCVTRYGMIWSATSQMFTFSAYLPNTKLFSVAYCGADLPKIIMPPPVGGIKNAAIRPSVCPTLVGVEFNAPCTRHSIGHFGGGLHSQSLDWYWKTKQYRKIQINKLNTNQKK